MVGLQGLSVMAVQASPIATFLTRPAKCCFSAPSTAKKTSKIDEQSQYVAENKGWRFS
jgi:hypothetical protein